MQQEYYIREAVVVLSAYEAATQKRKEAALKRDLIRVLEKACCRGCLFTGAEIIYLRNQIEEVYPGLSPDVQAARVRKLLGRRY